MRPSWEDLISFQIGSELLNNFLRRSLDPKGTDQDLVFIYEPDSGIS
jgi:hypothetical protein